jgi:hypothetical protein
MRVLIRTVIIKPALRTEALAYNKAFENCAPRCNPNCRQSGEIVIEAITIRASLARFPHASAAPIG